MRGPRHRRQASRLRPVGAPPTLARAMPALRRRRPHIGRDRAWRGSRPRLPATSVLARGGCPRDRTRRAGRLRREAGSSRTGPRRLNLLRGVPAVGGGIAEQRSHRRRSALSTLAQRRVGEPAHDGAAGRAPAPRLGVNLGEEIVGKGDHDLCHAASIPRYTQRLCWGKKWGKVPCGFQLLSKALQTQGFRFGSGGRAKVAGTNSGTNFDAESVTRALYGGGT